MGRRLRGEEWDNNDEDAGIHAFVATCRKYYIEYFTCSNETEESDSENKDEDEESLADDSE